MLFIYFLHVMNLHHLELFHAVATSGSLTAAARETFTSQSSVSKQLKVFEESLGVRLFDRLPRGVRLTQEGELLAAHARKIFLRRDLALDELGDLAGLKRGRLSLASSRTVGSYLLPGLLGPFLKEHPGIEARVRVGNTREVVELVKSGEVEIGLVEGPVEDPDVVCRAFARDELVAVVAPSHELAGAVGAVPLRRLVACALIDREPGSGTREILERELERRGVRWAPVLELESTEAIKGCVAAGMGVAVLSRLAVRRELEGGELVRLAVRGVSFARTLSVVRLPGSSPSRTGAAFEARIDGMGGKHRGEMG